MLIDLRRHCRRALCLDSGLSWLWPRWILLRALGFLGVVAFYGWCRYVEGLFGPYGLFPAESLLGNSVGGQGILGKLLGEPTLFWLSTAPWMLHGVSWVGLTASGALLLNIFPRIATVTAWLCYLSLIAIPSPISSPTQADVLLVELLFLASFVAPRGSRPGLAAASPAPRLPIFVLRVTAFKVMFVSGLCKFTTGDQNWWNFTAMDHMYETAPFPNVLAYYLHQLPHGYHVFETVVMLLAELGAPLLFIFGGNTLKFCALVLWILFQLGIQAPCNFGWLNIAAIAAGFIMLDDDFFAGIHEKFRLPPPLSKPLLSRPKSWALTAIMATSLLSSAVQTCRLLLPNDVDPPEAVNDISAWIGGLRIGNAIGLYRFMPVDRSHVLIEGSNDDGKTWRAYKYRDLVQDLDTMSPFHAPFLPRFDTKMHAVGLNPEVAIHRILPDLGRKLLWARPEILSLFRENPFPDRPPDMIRFGLYQYRYVDLATHRNTGQYWERRLMRDASEQIKFNRTTGEFH